MTTVQPLLRELITIPERIHQGDVVLRLTEGVRDIQATWVHTLAALTGQRRAHAFWLRLPIDEALRRASHRDQQAPTPEHRSYLHWVDQACTGLAQRDPQLTVLDVALAAPCSTSKTSRRCSKRSPGPPGWCRTSP